jgi:hypothetical protein
MEGIGSNTQRCSSGESNLWDFGFLLFSESHSGQAHHLGCSSDDQGHSTPLEEAQTPCGDRTGTTVSRVLPERQFLAEGFTRINSSQVEILFSFCC